MPLLWASVQQGTVQVRPAAPPRTAPPARRREGEGGSGMGLTGSRALRRLSRNSESSAASRRRASTASSAARVRAAAVWHAAAACAVGSGFAAVGLPCTLSIPRLKVVVRLCHLFAGEYVAGTLSLRVQQLDVRCETKTRDNVFVNIVVSVQYQVRTMSRTAWLHTRSEQFDCDEDWLSVCRWCSKPYMTPSTSSPTRSLK